MVISHGPTNPIAILIQDMPHGEDLKSGYAITGYPENMLRGFCKDAHLDFGKFWRSSLLKDHYEIPNTLKKDSDKTEFLKSKIAQYAPLLKEEIIALNPYLLIPLGDLSFSYLTGLSGIRKFRGSCVLADSAVGLSKPTKVLPILGPWPYLYQDHKMRFITRVDFNKIHKYLNDDLPSENLHKLWIAKDAGSLRAFIERSYKPDGLLVFDIETFASIPTCISLCFDGYESVCVPILDSTIDKDNRVIMMALVAKLLNAPIRKVNQNIKYDWRILERFGFHVTNVVGDTMLAASVLYCEFPKNLGFLASVYTDLPYFKDEGRSFNPLIHKKEQYYLYNAKDSLATHQIHTKQIDELEELGVRWVYDQLIKLIPKYRRMEGRGIRIDESCRARLLAKYTTLFAIKTRQLRKLMNNDTLNPLSPKQMGEVIYKVLEWHRARGKETTEEDELNMLLVFGHSKYPKGVDVLRTLIAARKLQKVIEILSLPLYPDGRFRGEFNLAGTETGRSSSGKTTDGLLAFDEKGKVVLRDLGHSLQTIGKHGFVMDGKTYGQDIRSMFVSSLGYSFVECDLSQAEARVDSVLAGNFDILNIFDGPIGIHRLTGSWAFNCDPLEIKKHVLVEITPGISVDRYLVSKTIHHAGERNMRENRLATMAQLTIEESTRVLKVFHEKQPEIRQVFHRDIRNCINASQCLIAPNGRRRDFYDRIDENTYNEGISQLPQAIVSDQVKFEGISPTTDKCPWAYFLIEAHDGILAEVPKGREFEFGSIYKKNVEVPIDFRRCSLSRDYNLTVPCEFAVGENWDNLKEVKI